MEFSVPFFGLLFDSDGTVIDSLELTQRHYEMLAREFDFSFDPDADSFHGVLSREVLAPYFSAPQLVKALDRLQEIDMSDFETLKPMPGAVAFMEQLHRAQAQGHEVPWGVVTSAPSALVRARWEHAGLDLPRVLVAAEDVSQGKPNPEPFLRGWRVLGEQFGDLYAQSAQIFPDQDSSQTRADEHLGEGLAGVIVFEDSQAGLQSGKAAGCVTVAVTATSGLCGEELEHADYVVNDLSQVKLSWREQTPVLLISGANMRKD